MPSGQVPCTVVPEARRDHAEANQIARLHESRSQPATLRRVQQGALLKSAQDWNGRGYPYLGCRPQFGVRRDRAGSRKCCRETAARFASDFLKPGGVIQSYGLKYEDVIYDPQQDKFLTQDE
jgi:hypothetical protein